MSSSRPAVDAASASKRSQDRAVGTALVAYVLTTAIELNSRVVDVSPLRL